MGVAASRVRCVLACNANMRVYIMRMLHGGAIVAACKAVGLPTPRAPLPCRTVMTSPYACVLCHAYRPYACYQLYVNHCLGWIVCRACQHLAQLGATRHYQKEQCVPAAVVFPSCPSVLHIAMEDALKVRFPKEPGRGAAGVDLSVAGSDELPLRGGRRSLVQVSF